MKKVLIIDDSLLQRNFIIRVFSEFDVEILEAENGAVGLELYKEHKPDLVTCDITMPEMNGVTTLEKILKFDENAKVIIVSAVGQKQNVIKCLELGAKAFITKPFVEDDIVKNIKKFLPLD